jgi:hypothetical protein
LNFCQGLGENPALPGFYLLPMMPPPREEVQASDASAALANGEMEGF